MRIRTQILLGYGLLAALLLATTVGSALGFKAIADQMDQILSQDLGRLRSIIQVDDTLLKEHETALQATRDLLHRENDQRLLMLGLLAAVALMSLALLSRTLHNGVLLRLSSLQQVAEALAAGDLSRRADESFQDELGLIARQLNAALDLQGQMDRAAIGKFNLQNQVILALLARLTSGALVVDPSGDLIASTLEYDPWVETILEAIRNVRSEQGTLELTVDKSTLTLKRLVSPRDRFAGWLIVPKVD